MNYTVFRYVFLLSLCCFFRQGAAQVAGTFDVPGTQYASLGELVTALNQQGVGAGGVTVNIRANQTAPAGGYVLGSTTLNGSVSAARPVVFNGLGFTITASPGTGDRDGIFTIAGTDYVTIDSLNLADPSSNNTDDLKMEWGYALLKLQASEPFDGCHHVTIRKCTVSMRYSATRLTYGIYGDHRIAGAAGVMTINSSAPGDAHSYNKIQDNVISGCLEGIRFFGMNLAAGHNRDNEISGNRITFGGGGSLTGYGIYVQHASGVQLVHNTVQLTPGSTIMVNGIAAGTGSGDLTMEHNTVTLQGNNTTSAVTGITLTQSYTGNGVLRCSDNVCRSWSFPAATSSQIRGIYINNSGNAFDSMYITRNLIADMTLGGGSHTSIVHPIYNIAGSTVRYLDMSENKVANLVKNGASGDITCLYNSIGSSGSPSSAAGQFHLRDNMVSDVSGGSGIYGLQVTLQFASSYTAYLENNRVTRCTITGTGIFYGIHAANNGGASHINGNVIDTINTNSGALHAIYSTLATPSVYSNTVSDLTTTTGTIYGYNSAGGRPYVYSNNFRNLRISGGSGTIYGIYFSTLNGTAAIYNNFISNYSTGTSYSAPASLWGIYLGLSALADALNQYAVYKVFHNTICIRDIVTTGTDLGITGIWYKQNANGRAKLDMRNNIVHLDVVPRGAGFTTAVRREGGTPGVFTGDLLPSTNGNVYYVPDADSSFIYAEGATAAALVNKFSLRNDPLFNTTCGLSLYKSFTGADQNSFTEDNMVPGLQPGIWTPSGASYAKQLGVVTNDPQVTTDYAGVVRSATPDAGALEFNGVFADVAPPSISYTPLPARVYCVTESPVLSAAITDASGVAAGAGVRPRIYYRKASETGVFGNYPADNTSSFNGWKYTEATGSGPSYTFRMDYNLLHAPVAAGDSMVYFIAAQDSATVSNVSIQPGGLAPGYCAVSVNLEPAAGPLAATPAVNGFRILAPQFTITARHTAMCAGGSSPLLLTPVPQGVEIRWQQDGGTGNWTDIPGANTGSYTTSALSGTGSFRVAAFVCGSGSDSVATGSVQITVNPDPQIVSVQPGVHCGAGQVVLEATAPQGSQVHWYDSPVSDSILHTGAAFTTPALAASAVYYAAASGAEGSEIVPSPSPTGRTLAAVWSVLSGDSLYFTVHRPVTINSVKMYPAHDAATGTQTATISVIIRDTASQTDFTGQLYQFNISSTPSEQIVPVNISLQPGVYRMTAAMTGINSLSNASGAAYPYVSPSGAVSITGSGTSSSLYKYFYEWSVSSACTGPRVPVMATIDSVIASVQPAGPFAFCAGDSLTLYAKGDTGLVYQWQHDETPVSGAVDSLYIVNQSGDYTVIVSNASCSDTSVPVQVTVHPLPQPVITANGQTLGAGLYDSYQWNRNGAPVDAANDREYIPSGEGDYTVTVTDGNGCTATSPVHSITTGIAFLNGDDGGITLYPNPNNGSFVLKGRALSSVSGLEVLDMTGRVVLALPLNRTNENTETAVALHSGSVPAGMYLIRLQAGDRVYLLSFLKNQ